MGPQFPDSSKPMRSARFKPYGSARFSNNRLRLSVARGTYRLQCVSGWTAGFQSQGVFVAVGRDDFASHFGATPAITTCLAEYLHTSGMAAIDVGYRGSVWCSLEVDVLDNEVIWIWSPSGTETIKYVKVGDLPDREAILSDRER